MVITNFGYQLLDDFPSQKTIELKLLLIYKNKLTAIFAFFFFFWVNNATVWVKTFFWVGVSQVWWNLTRSTDFSSRYERGNEISFQNRNKTRLRQSLISSRLIGYSSYNRRLHEKYEFSKCAFVRIYTLD